LGLVHLGFLEENKKGKTHIFHPARNLRELLHLPPKIEKMKKDKEHKPIAVTVKQESGTPTPPTKPAMIPLRQASLLDIIDDDKI